jgi:hypothetical protein
MAAVIARACGLVRLARQSLYRREELITVI